MRNPLAESEIKMKISKINLFISFWASMEGSLNFELMARLLAAQGRAIALSTKISEMDDMEMKNKVLPSLARQLAFMRMAKDNLQDNVKLSEALDGFDKEYDRCTELIEAILKVRALQ